MKNLAVMSLSSWISWQCTLRSLPIHKNSKRFKELFRSASIIQRNQFPVPLVAALLFPKMKW